MNQRVLISLSGSTLCFKCSLKEIYYIYIYICIITSSHRLKQIRRLSSETRRNGEIPNYPQKSAQVQLLLLSLNSSVSSSCGCLILLDLKPPSLKTSLTSTFCRVCRHRDNKLFSNYLLNIEPSSADASNANAAVAPA